MTLAEMLKRAHKSIGTPPCEKGLCNDVRVKICADHAIGCRAWKYYVNTGKMSQAHPIRKFRDTICNKCKKEKSGCEKKCLRMKA